MGEKISAVEDYLNCQVCTETFRDPVSLSCNHSFCSSCLQQFWQKAETKNCPICRRRSSKDHIGVNFALKELADVFAGRQKSGSSETEGGEKVVVICSKHPEEGKPFCKDDQTAGPAYNLPHQGRKVVPVEEAVRELKEELKCDLKSLQDKTEKYKYVEETYKDMIHLSKKQLLSTERQITAEFNKLHQFLREEEQSRLAALREEGEHKRKAISTEMKKIQEHISSLSLCISAVEEELQKHSEDFLRNYDAAQSRARAQCSLSDPQLLSGALPDVAKHLGNLSFRVWEKMREKVRFSPVILDPNTANPWLYLSEDLTSVRNGDTPQKLPDNPERMTFYANVLGSEGFSSGRHSWEVEVGDLPFWTVGLAEESVDRKGEVFASPKYGRWCLSHHSGKHTSGVGGALSVKRSLQKIRVQLDYEGGEVSFYDSEDSTHIYTHRDTFTEKLLPYFSVGEAGEAQTKMVRVCVKADAAIVSLPQL